MYRVLTEARPCPRIQPTPYGGRIAGYLRRSSIEIDDRHLSSRIPMLDVYPKRKSHSNYHLGESRIYT